ncbi:MAG: LapA family protein [Acidimicrobiia bacterium]|nr:LapA family protein [Acidimicrobiia bacterium]MBT8214590.1 LapA family protein [Acidimicrobiia bacterium]NNC90867.1 LapA family protein [Acidimicrobiia bacterium]
MTDQGFDPIDDLPPLPPEPAASPATATQPREIPWKLIGVAVIAVLLTLFGVQNTQSVEVNFLWLDWEFPLIIVIAISVLASAVLTWLALHMRRRRKTKAIAAAAG